ncbi:MAG: YgiQ family radical SAM protein [Lentisphaerae bacterium]|nr:MAG: YgiQ family radical SAM protein [Lentisphaerota bacterium]
MVSVLDALDPDSPQPPFIPISREECAALGWDELDIVLVTGDAYVDHPSFGCALIGRVLLAAGYRVGIIAQPDWRTPESLKVFGRPALGFAITSGNLDSMLRIYTAARRKRQRDEYSENGQTGRVPPLATVVYANLARQAYPGIPVIIGGLEASMRRIAHYDYWQDKIRPSILCDSKADLLVYGMGERAILEICERLRNGEDLKGIRGTARLAGDVESRQLNPPAEAILPAYETIQGAPERLLESVLKVEREMNPYCGTRLYQSHGKRMLVMEPPQFPLSQEEMDRIYGLAFAMAPHPSYRTQIPAWTVIRDSLTAVRGCPGGCSFCSIGLHQGKFIQTRSLNSLVKTAARLVEKESFRGTISDVGGPTANSYGCRQEMGPACQRCRRPSCLFPSICPRFVVGEKELEQVLEAIQRLSGVRHVFISSGIRMDLARRQKALMRSVIANHVGGHLKIAPEHLHPEVLKLMRKNRAEDFYDFLRFFQEESRRAGKKQYLIPYFIANFPGSGEEEFEVVHEFLRKHHWRPQQVQDFIPLPMTVASAMYYCGRSPDGKRLTVNRGLKERRRQLEALKHGGRPIGKSPASHRSGRRRRKGKGSE